MKNIIRQWGRMLARLCSGDARSVIDKTVTTDTISRNIGAEMPERPAKPGCQWYRVEKASHDINLGVHDDALVPVQYRCMICGHAYVVPVKAWKIRSCLYVASPCKKCNTFQTIDMAELRSEYRARAQQHGGGLQYVAVTSLYQDR
ncbi:hypothetical protein MCP_2906 [Methanocella paludicola SANAE]|uniref:Uncharacterized protein n=1 Tax=Methanocella paludicola (strain DSM 17711 / JCM 13418 / NBRC 101707 / SANAE) TaxID=304371 RepID=D1Z2Q6_METPS|nr:hypothetical protein [Methanocella paludicola]BAI62978.1 hypothetical protein MCP_2906 [Methanocella paludicola SANAE]